VVSFFVGKKRGQVDLVWAAAFFLGFVIVSSGPLPAQIGGSGSINGTVTDPPERLCRGRP
jgi:hypothetical protein